MTLENYLISKEKNDVIFFPGDMADNAYIVKKGMVEVFVYDKEGNSVTLDMIREGDILGDMALILESPRTAGARAVVQTELYYISKDNLMEIIRNKPEFAVKLIMIFRERLKNVNNRLISVKLKKIRTIRCDQYEESLRSSQRAFHKGTIIFREFDSGKMGYIVMKGSVRLVKLNPFLQEESTLAVLGPGEIFGELALMGSGKRIATAVSDSDDTVLLTFDEKNFAYLLYHNPEFCMKILKICCKRIREMDQKFAH